MKFLCEQRGISLDSKCLDGSGVLHRLIDAGNYGFNEKIMPSLITSHNITFTDSSGRTPLILAASLSRSKVIAHLLKATEDADQLNRQDFFGNTALHYACMRLGPWAAWIAQQLLARNVRTNILNRDGASVLQFACYDPADCCGAHLKLPVVSALLRQGVSVNIPDGNGTTALHNAAFTGNEVVIEALLKLGAQVNARETAGVTPLHLASAQGHTAVVTELMKKKAKIHCKTFHGHTPLHFAAIENRDEATIKCLVEEHRANVHATDQEGKKPSQLASNEKVKKLLERYESEITQEIASKL